MLDRRIETRLLCADLVELQWKDTRGKKFRVIANLEDISVSGACLQVDTEVPLGTSIRMTCPKGELFGIVRYCNFQEIGYYLGIEFDANSRWSQRVYKPEHLLDPRKLAQPAPANRPVKKDGNSHVK